jgi:hypothetical protein
LSAAHDIRFPGESDEYRRERDRLLEAEVELRRAIERVATQRRALPLGGSVPEDYRFEEATGGDGEITLSEIGARPDQKLRPGAWLQTPAATVLSEQHLQPRLPRRERPGLPRSELLTGA